MGKTKVSDKHRPTLQKIEAIVEKSGPISTQDLAARAGVSDSLVRNLIKDNYSSVERDNKSRGRGKANVYVTKPTLSSIANPHRAPEDKTDGKTKKRS